RIVRNEIAPRTARQYREHLKPLRAFFQYKLLSQITAGDLFEYQRQRSEQAGASLINHECSMLRQLLASTGTVDASGLHSLWARIGPFYRPMRLPDTSPGRALPEEAARHLFQIASTNSAWRVAYLCAVITANTTAGPGEIKHLQLRDVNLETHPPRMFVREGAKNPYRKRSIPLNADALWAVRQLLGRAHDKG